MTKQLREWSSLSATLLITFLAVWLSSCLAWWQPERTYEHEISSNRGYYIIDPDTILEALANGKANIFKQASGPPTWTYSLGDQTIMWNQANYFQIVQAFHEFVWHESLESWKLHSMSFRIACEDIERGFLYGDFEYYKIINPDNEETRLVRTIHVRPGDKSIDWWERQLLPIREKWPVIDLSTVRVTVDEALALAESNGGNTARLSVSNECNIYLLLKLDAFYEGWQVGYSGRGPKNIFKIYIEPFSGEYEVVSP
jgi:hypothetical protein